MENNSSTGRPMYRDVIDRRLRTRFVVIVSLFVLLTASASTAYFYFIINGDLDGTYSQKINAITLLKTSLIKHSLLVYILLALLAAVSIVLATVLYTHRIVGPLVRMRTAARQLSEGNLDVVVKFREKDAVSSLADALNRLSSKYQERYSLMGRALDEMRQDVEELRKYIKNGDSGAAEQKRKQIKARAAEIYKTLSAIKL